MDTQPLRQTPQICGYEEVNSTEISQGYLSALLVRHIPPCFLPPICILEFTCLILHAKCHAVGEYWGYLCTSTGSNVFRGLMLPVSLASGFWVLMCSTSLDEAALSIAAQNCRPLPNTQLGIWCFQRRGFFCLDFEHRCPKFA